MMRLIPIEIRTFSYKKIEELPESFRQESEEVKILEISDRWYQGNNNPDFPAADYYKVTGSDGSQYLLKHQMGNDTWFLCRSD